MQVRVERLGRQGDGVAEGPVYVSRALPGELVEGALVDGVMSAPRILEPSDQRVAPPCRHFKSCGGCQMQHAADGLVAAWKTDIVAHALDRVGVSTTLRPIVISPARSRRRAKFSARKTKSGSLAGFHGRASDGIVDVVECPLITTGLHTALPLVRALASAGGSRKAAIEVMCTQTMVGLDVQVTGGKPLDTALRQALPALCATHDVARLHWNGEIVAQEAPPQVLLGGVHVALPPGAFLQATVHGEAALCAAVTEALGPAHHIADLFSGCGTFALPLAQNGPVLAVEGDSAMVAALQSAANHAQLAYPVTASRRDLFNDPLTAAELGRFDAVVLDPPRAGALAQAGEIAASTLRRVAYVSCDPGSFARDAKVLVRSGFNLEWVQTVDQFRWSSHVELAALFTRG